MLIDNWCGYRTNKKRVRLHAWKTPDCTKNSVDLENLSEINFFIHQLWTEKKTLNKRKPLLYGITVNN